MKIGRWLSRRFPEAHTTGDSRNIMINCPMCEKRGHGQDTKQHMGVSTIMPVVHCFRCEWKGRWIDLVMEVEGVGYADAVQIVGADTPNIDDFHDGPQVDKAAQVGDILPGFCPLTRQATKDNVLARLCATYLRRRGVSDDMIFGGQWGYVPDTGYVYCMIDNLYWQGRAVLLGNPKYLNPMWPKGDTLFNWRALYDRSMPQKLYVVEGIFSAIAMLNRGHRAVAILGKVINKKQASRLAKYPGTLVIMLDADARDRVTILCNALLDAGHSDLKVALLKHGDPDTCDEWDEHKYTLQLQAALRMYHA